LIFGILEVREAHADARSFELASDLGVGLLLWRR
jgi:hypothetical protein